MELLARHQVHISGDGPVTLVFAHGFGCDQQVWRFMTPHFSQHYRLICYDLAGCGASDLDAWDPQRYASLHGHADDLLAILDACANGPVVFIGHSVSAMIGMLAAIKAPARFLGQVMIAPSPCYINDAGYIGGFSRSNIDELLDTMDANYLGWSSSMAPLIMGAPEQPQLAQELTNNFCRNDPVIARHFGRVCFTSDHRADLRHNRVPALILQAHDDMIAPPEVGAWLQRHLPASRLQMVQNHGHCPHMSAPDTCARLSQDFVATLGRV